MRPLGRSVLEDDPKRVSAPRPHAADAVTQVHPIGAARAIYRPVMHSEHDCIALVKRHHLCARLHARPLLGQDELAAGKILAGLRQQEGNLQWKG
jgi:hypothetical protein